MKLSVSARAAALAAAVLAAAAIGARPASAAGSANGGPGYFIPHPKAPAPLARHAPPVHETAPKETPQGMPRVSQQKLPPIPQLPALPKAKGPPKAHMGVLSVSAVMRKSSAVQGVEKIVNARRAKLRAQAKAAEKKWEAEQKKIEAEKGRVSKKTLTAREKHLQNEIEHAQVDFHNRGVAVEISARKALGKIEATLIAVIRQIAEAHGMNLVLHRSQVALNVNAFDVTDEVAKQLNKILPQVAVPKAEVPHSVNKSHSGHGRK